MRGVFESLFGENVAVDQLDPAKIKALHDGLLDYAKDWPDEVFTLVVTQPQDGLRADIDEAGIEKVKNLLQVIADGEGWKLNFAHVKPAEIEQIFAGLKGPEFILEKVNMTYWAKEDQGESRDFDIHFVLTGLKYHANTDEFSMDVKLKKLEEV